MEKIISYLIPAGAGILGWFIGWIFKKYIFKRILKVAKKTTWRADEVILKSFKGHLILWFILLGVFIAIQFVIIPLNVKTFIKIAILIILIISGTLAIANITGNLVQVYSDRFRETFPSSSIFKNLAKGIVILLGVLVLLNTLGISITPFITALGIGGLAVALALQDTLSNLFAGIHILMTKQIRPGDYVKLETGEEGFVHDITWRNTTIQMIPNNMIIVPNSKISSMIIINYHLPLSELSVMVPVGVSYGSDLEKVEKVTIEVAKEVMKEVEGAVPEFEPFIRYNAFGESSINFNVILRAKDYVSQFIVRHEFIKRLQKRFKEEGIEIPFPIRTVYLKKEN